MNNKEIIPHMVTETDNLYQCDECGLRYEDREIAEECERFCREHNACNTEIIGQSVDT